MKDRIIKRTERMTWFNKNTGRLEVDESTYWIVQTWRWWFPVWISCRYYDKIFKEFHIKKFWSQEDAEIWRKGYRTKTTYEIEDVVLD